MLRLNAVNVCGPWRLLGASLEAGSAAVVPVGTSRLVGNRRLGRGAAGGGGGGGERGSHGSAGSGVQIPELSVPLRVSGRSRPPPGLEQRAEE